jgi:hypothetical protein
VFVSSSNSFTVFCDSASGISRYPFAWKNSSCSGDSPWTCGAAIVPDVQVKGAGTCRAQEEYHIDTEVRATMFGAPLQPPVSVGGGRSHVRCHRRSAAPPLPRVGNISMSGKCLAACHVSKHIIMFTQSPARWQNCYVSWRRLK